MEIDIKVSQMIEVFRVRGTRDLLKFISIEYKLMRDDPVWVPPLFWERFTTFRKSAFFRHSDVEFFYVKDGKDIVARATAQVDKLHLERWRDDAGFFGWLVSVNDKEVLAKLLDAVFDFLKKRGMKVARGPFSFNINGESGMLIRGFNLPPYVMMPHNPPYLPELFEKLGFKKAKDLFAWLYDARANFPSFAKLFWTKLKDKVQVEEFSLKDVERNTRDAVNIFNRSWYENWGFVPITEDEGRELAHAFRLILDPRIAFFIRWGKKRVAMCIAVPNINEVLKDLRGAKYPHELLKLLLRRRRIKTGRLMLLGVLPEVREELPQLPIFAVVELWQRAKKAGYIGGELSWTLEDNIKVNKLIELSGAVKYKIYRIWEIKIS